MMRNKLGWSLFIILVWSLLAGGVILAQSAGGYDLSWWSIDGATINHIYLPIQIK